MAVCVGVTLYVGDQATHLARVPLTTTPASAGLAYTDVSFPARIDATPLSGWWIPAAAARGTIVLARGYADDRLDLTVPALSVAAALHKAGYDVLMFDFRGSGRSAGKAWSPSAAWSSGTSRARPTSRGAARPARSASLAGRWAPAPRCWRLEGDPARQGRRGRPLHPALLPAHPAGLLAGMAGLADRPVLLIAGTADRTIPPSNAEALEAADPRAQLWLVPGADHTHAYRTDPARYMQHVLALFARMT